MATVPKNYRTSISTIAVAGAGPFPLGFRLFDNDGIKVYVNGTVRTDFTLAATYDEGFTDQATITFNADLSASDALRIDASLAPWRQEDLTNGDRSLVQKLNVELSRLWSALSEVRRDAMRSLRGFDLMEPVEGIDLNTIAGAETYAATAAAAAVTASASATLAVSAQQNLFNANRGPWATATVYTQGQTVQEGGSTHLCLANHTSGVFATDVGAGRWQVYAQKGNAGAGTGDVLAANNGSDFASAGTVRSNLSLFGALLVAETGADALSRVAANPRGMFFVAGTGMTNTPPGGAVNDVFWGKGLDANNITAFWVKADGTIFTNRRTSGTWSGWIAQATQAYVAAVRAVAQFSSRRAQGANGPNFPTGTTAALELTNTDQAGLGVTLSANLLTFANAGMYLIEAFVPVQNSAGAGRSAQALLHNVTAATEIARSQGATIGTGSAQTLVISVVATVSAGNQIELRGIANGSSVFNGRAASLGQEIYNIVRVRAL